MIDLADLMQPMADNEWEGGKVALTRITADHREAMRAVFDATDAVWEIYPANFTGSAFDPAFDALTGNPGRNIFIVLLDGKVVGMTSYLNLALDRQAVEIGGTFMAQSVRGSGINARVKKLMLDRAFGCGIRRVEFRIDERNGRSQAAVRKLGAVKEGVLRAERITWTGHIRDTGVFSILAEEWNTRT